MNPLYQTFLEAPNSLCESAWFYLNDCKTHLDVGSGEGASLRGLDPRTITCIEAYAPSIHKLKEQGYKVLTGQAIDILRKLVKQGRKFDRVTSFDFLEHLEKPEALKALEMMKKLAAKELIIFSPIEQPKHAGFMDAIYAGIPEDQRELQRHKWFIDPSELGLDIWPIHNFHASGFDAFFGVLYTDRPNYVSEILESLIPNVTSTRAGDGIFNAECMRITDPTGWSGGSRIEAVRISGKDLYRPSLRIDGGVTFGFADHIGCADRLHIQKNVLIGQRVTIVDHDHAMGYGDIPTECQPLICSPTSIGRGSWIGDGAVVTKGVHIGHHSKIGANAVVTKSVPPYSTVVGVPGSVVKTQPTIKGLVSIIIPTFNTRQMTSQCIEYVYQNTPDPYEIILVDNGSRDDTTEYMDATNLCDKIITLPKNKGYGGGVNAGIKEASGEYLCFLNSDVFVTEGWLEPLLRALAFDPHISVAAPLWNVRGGYQEPPVEIFDANGQVPFDPSTISHRLAALFPTQMRLGPMVPAVCWLLRKSDVDKIGFFDERFGLGNYEDDDYCRRISDTLDGCVAVPLASFVYHLTSQTFATAKIDYQAQMTKNKALYVEKWGEEPIVWQDRMSAIIREKFNGR